MSSWFTRAFGYGLGVAAGRAIFEEEPRAKPIRQQTEEEILAAEKQYDEDEKQLDANDAKARAGRQRAAS